MSQNEQTLGALFAEYEENSKITVLDKGKYKLEVTACTPKNKGVQPVYKCIEGPNAGARVMAGGIFPGDSEGGRFAFFRKLERFGLTADYFRTNPTLADVAKALVGRQVEVELDVKEWNGEPRNEMGFAIKLISAPPAPAVGGVPVATPEPSAAPPVTSAPALAPAAAAPPAVTPTEAPPVAVVEGDPGF